MRRKRGDWSLSKSRHTEAQMTGARKQMEAGRREEGVAREGRCVEACAVRLEGQVRRDERWQGAGGQAVARGDYAVAQAGDAGKATLAALGVFVPL